MPGLHDYACLILTGKIPVLTYTCFTYEPIKGPTEHTPEPDKLGWYMHCVLQQTRACTAGYLQLTPCWIEHSSTRYDSVLLAHADKAEQQQKHCPG